MEAKYLADKIKINNSDKLQEYHYMSPELIRDSNRDRLKDEENKDEPFKKKPKYYSGVIKGSKIKYYDIGTGLLSSELSVIEVLKGIDNSVYGFFVSTSKHGVKKWAIYMDQCIIFKYIKPNKLLNAVNNVVKKKQKTEKTDKPKLVIDLIREITHASTKKSSKKPSEKPSKNPEDIIRKKKFEVVKVKAGDKPT